MEELSKRADGSIGWWASVCSSGRWDQIKEAAVSIVAVKDSRSSVVDRSAAFASAFASASASGCMDVRVEDTISVRLQIPLLGVDATESIIQNVKVWETEKREGRARMKQRREKSQSDCCQKDLMLGSKDDELREEEK